MTEPEEAVLLDTNALVAIGSLGVDLLEELRRVAPGHEPLVPTGVLRELRGLSEGGGEDARAARLALKIAEDLERVETEGPVDDALVRLARERGWEVVTNDAELIRRLRENGVPVIYIRQKSHLERSVD